MRRKLVVGNWKMNLARAEAVSLAEAVAKGEGAVKNADLAVCPPLVYIDAVARALRESRVAWGAQNVYFEPNGAYTGEVSAAMLADLGCRYAIVGHSERRHILGETDEAVNRKAKAALAAGIVPIVCVGEQLADRESGLTAMVIRRQVEGSLAGLSAEEMGRLVVAYEPVWAIGTGKVATPDQAQEVHADLRKLIESGYNAQTAVSLRILYGGSVKPDNAGDLLSQADIDGALVGGASLKAADFLAIAAACGSGL